MAEINAGTLAAYRAARAAAKDAISLRDKLAEDIKRQAGSDTVLTVDGVKVGGYDYIKSFPAKRFISDHPELAEQFMTYRTDSVLNEALLARSLPDLYRDYQTRQLSIED